MRESFFLQATLQGHAGAVSAVSFSPAGNFLATGGQDSAILVWDVASKAIIGKLVGHERDPISLLWLDESTLLSSDFRTIKVWDIRSVSCTRVIAAHFTWVYDLAISSDRSMLASAGGNQVKTWSVKDWAQIGQSKKLAGSCEAVRFLPGTDRVLTNEGSRLQVRDPASLQVQSEIGRHLRTITSIASSANAELIATSSDDKSCKLWSVGEQREFHHLKGHTESVRRIVFSPDSTTVVSAGWEPVIRIWNTVSGNQIASLITSHEKVYALAFSPDGSRLASGGTDKNVCIWSKG